jgi:hypothetical protein
MASGECKPTDSSVSCQLVRSGLSFGFDAAESISFPIV